MACKRSLLLLNKINVFACPDLWPTKAFEATKENKDEDLGNISKRQTKGEFNSLVEYLMLFDHFYFFRMFRMNPSRVEELLSWVAPSIIKSSKFRDVATPSKRLCMILQYFATGDAQAKLLSCYRVSPPAESRKTETVAQRCSVK